MNMRTPDYERDGWTLDDGEQRHHEAPDTFWIPDLELRQILEPGDFAQLIFRISANGSEEVERMWVIVREIVPNGYLDMLDNKPSLIDENDEFWLGAELPFEYRHIIAVSRGNAESKALAFAPAPIPWNPK